MNLEQLEALKRQLEEDYRLDTDAIDRLLQRSAPTAGAKNRSLSSAQSSTKRS